MSSNRNPGYHQDYIARIRYSNALPPPPFAPKLLQIANSGLASGQYTSASFASRLVRDQTLNIEADAELGMNIDLVGMPGVFDGDDKSIMFPDRPPPLDPRDRILLKPLASLGKSSAAQQSVSFLRRTEYITVSNPLRSNNAAARSAGMRKPPAPEKAANKNDPAAMLRQIEKSFNLAYPEDAYTGPDDMQHIRGNEISPAERRAWDKPEHPTKKNLTVLDSYPILPDLAALGDTGSYIVVKYNGNPSIGNYDPRLDHAVFMPTHTDEEVATYQAAVAKNEADPTRYPKPRDPLVHFTVYLPQGDTTAVIPRLKRKFDVYDADADAPDLYTEGIDEEDPELADPFFRYEKLRPYETFHQLEFDAEDGSAWNDTVAMALHDTLREKGRGPKRQKAAYIYPVGKRIQMRPKRAKRDGVGMVGLNSQAYEKLAVVDDSADQLELRIGPPDEDAKALMDGFKLKLDSTWVE
ncbi:Paf1-domain-containing protein [Microthyrium microscopicum]|uniref:Paf1-domain-containing protein n=1 Tax=Microthyrium microscopicum TaxID=703497 RepID=A0A6A6ULN8_9PEZI|nr:Paf1-domain-containing protein [Microthyrium microscopicum]